MPKNINQNSVVDTSVNKVMVNSAPQGAGLTVVNHAGTLAAIHMP